MDFKEFVQAVVTHFEGKLGQEYTIRVNEVTKNNNVHLNGIILKQEGQKVTPNIYLNGYYEKYEEQKDFEAICKEIWNTYQQALQEADGEALQLDLTWENQKGQIVFRLINYEENQRLAAKIPYIRFLDLAVTFYSLVKLEDDTVSMLPISNAIMEHWQADVKCLLQHAMKNTPSHFPLVFSTLEEVIQKLAGPEMIEKVKISDEEHVTMYVVTNQQGINGAAVMLYQEEFHELAEKLGGRVYILPSSIHEVILLPFEEEIDVEKLLELVQEVNQNQVPVEEVLSSHIYLYDSEMRSFQVF
ncbi:DUF5688 family protein [[Clostridium] polysaccharolyticum]|nr:DUF5688 family protein [[Clostridium] polysaccharolyticum]